jgi:DNA polymerase
MARAIHGVEAGGSLASLVQRYNLGEKGKEVIDALGKRRSDFSSDQLNRYGAYCRNDVELTFALFDVLANNFPENEHSLIDITIKMFTRPQLMLDDALLVERLEDIKREKSELLSALMSKLDCDTEEAVRKKLCSNKQFAEVLHAWGVETPLKVSATTSLWTFALAKTDEGFIALTEHEDPFIQQLCAVRLGTKSTIEESRVARFIDIGARNRGYLPVPLKYYGSLGWLR